MSDQLSRVRVRGNDPDQRLQLGDYLRREGFEVAAVKDGAGMDA